MTVARGARGVPVAVLLATLWYPVPVALAHQLPSGTATTPQDPEADRDRAAPVLIGGEAIIWITTGAGPYTTQFRADRISQRLRDAIRDRSLRDPTVTVVENEGSSELRAGSRLLMVVTQQDARSLGGARTVVAQQYARELETAIRAERVRYAPATLVRSGIYGLVATLVLGALCWVILRLARATHDALERWRGSRLGALRLQQAEIVSSDHVGLAIERVIRAGRLVLILLAHPSVPDLRARAVSVDPRPVGDASRVCGHPDSYGRRRRGRLSAEPGVCDRHRCDLLLGDSTRGAALPPD